MLLHTVTIEGYRSIKDSLTLICDQRVTVILGANDHGKTNLLEALLHLNPNRGFDADSDLNWDSMDRPEDLPRVTYELSLSEEEESDLKEYWAKMTKAEECINASKEKADHYSQAKAEHDSATALVESATKSLETADAELKSKQAEADQNPDDNEIAKALGKVKLDWEKANNQKQTAETDLAAINSTIELKRREWLTAEAIKFQALAERDSDNGEIELEAILQRKRAEAIAARSQFNKLSSMLENTKKKLEEISEGDDEKERKKLEVQIREIEADLGTAKDEMRVADKGGNLANAILELIADGQIKADVYGTEFDSKELEIPARVILERKGIDGQLVPLTEVSFSSELFLDFLTSRLPRVELIGPVDKLADSVSEDSLITDEYSFMRGIFYYADLYEEDWDDIFVQNDVTIRRLRVASKKLNETMKNSWTQGQELEFRLHHDSKTSEIDLLVEDPAVEGRDVRVSRRSSGFTHFFALRTILHAREIEAPAKSYIWIFDEPGIHLHPFGQHDLLQVIETLAA